MENIAQPNQEVTQNLQNTHAEQSIDLKEVAKSYAAKGFRVIPLHTPTNGRCSCANGDCSSVGKHPRISNGVKGATTDIEIIDEWWNLWPSANIGIATGAASNCFVLDVDARSGGLDSLDQLLSQHGPLPETAWSNTGGGGNHYFFTHPGFDVKNRSGFVPGLDIKGENGYVVAAPSVHGSGQEYRWDSVHELTDTDLAQAPQWLLDCLAQRDQASNVASPLVGGTVSEGGRNSFLTSIAGTLRKRGVEGEVLFNALSGINQQSCIPPLAVSEVRSICESIERYPSGSSVIEWPDRISPLPQFTLQVPKLRERMIPMPLRAWIIDACDRMQVSLDYMAPMAIAVISSVIGRQVGIRPKQKDNFTVIPNLWSGLIAPPSTLKSPAISEAMSPLFHLTRIAKKEFEAKGLAAEVKQMGIESQIKKLEKLLPNSTTEDRIEALEQIKDLKEKLKETIVTEKRYLTNDATIEKMALLLCENPNGLLFHRDELTGFLRSMDKSGHEPDRAFYLECWNGYGSFNVDRVGRGSISVPSLCLSIVGGIQPSRFKKYITEATENTSSNDGFIQRFQLLIYPEKPKSWRLVDRAPDKQAKQRVIRLFETLSSLNPMILAPHYNPPEDAVPYLRFNEEAQGVYNEWITKLEQRLRDGSIHQEAFENHLGKYRSLMPSLSLIFHLLAFAEEPMLSNVIPAHIAKLAIEWCDYLEAHAQKVYGLLGQTKLDSANALIAKIKGGRVKDGETIRSIYRHHWTQLDTPKKVESAIALLSEHGWVQTELNKATGGAPTEVIRFHPQLFEHLEKGTAKTANTSSGSSGTPSQGVH